MSIQRIQGRLLDMAVQITNILHKNDIPYTIFFGTLIGAVRHQGFIPWDDDFDLLLFDESYEKAMQVLKEELPQDLILENEEVEPNYFHGWSRVKCKNTITRCSFYEQDNIYKNKGLLVDLYRAKKINKIDSKIYHTQGHLDYLDRRRKINLIDEKLYQEKKEYLNQIIVEEETKNKNLVCSTPEYIYAMHLPLGEASPEDLFPLKKYNFEGHQFFGPNNAHNILTNLYGDYMKLPPEDQRKVHYDNVEFL